MYSMVLMMALSNGAAVPAGSPVVGPMTLHVTTHEAYRCHSCCHGCHGYYGCCCSYSYGCCGDGGMSCCCGGGMMMTPAMPPKTPEPIREKPKEEKMEKEISAPATIQVSLPADAKLTIDGAATTSSSSQRTFQSPTLEPGKDYYYTLKAQVVREGKTLTSEVRISVRPGVATPVVMSDFRDAGVAAR